MYDANVRTGSHGTRPKAHAHTPLELMLALRRKVAFRRAGCSFSRRRSQFAHHIWLWWWRWCWRQECVRRCGGRGDRGGDGCGDGCGDRCGEGCGEGPPSEEGVSIGGVGVPHEGTGYRGVGVPHEGGVARCGGTGMHRAVETSWASSSSSHLASG